MELFAEWCFDGFQFHRNCVLHWENGAILSLQTGQACKGGMRRARGLLPGFINLHAHLELSALHGLLPRRVDFPIWVSELRKHLVSWNAKSYRNSVRQGIRKSLQGGTTTLVDVGNSGACSLEMSATPLKIVALQEILSLKECLAAERLQAAGSKPVCPHSLYGTHARVIQDIASRSRSRAYPFTFHLEESQGEHDLYVLGSGDFRNWLDSIAPEHPFLVPGASGFERASSIVDLHRAILAHGNFLTSEECRMLAGLDATVVHCPQSHDYFGHSQDPVEACRKAGLRLAIGTDSLASADSLSLWDQLGAFHAAHPSVSLEEALSMVSSVPGRALDENGLLGTLKTGAPADLMVVESFDPLNGFASMQRVQIQELWIRGEKYEEA